ncbi:unnamed protein product, partial [Discosporangium mesarthrocarpum]
QVEYSGGVGIGNRCVRTDLPFPSTLRSERGCPVAAASRRDAHLATPLSLLRWLLKMTTAAPVAAVVPSKVRVRHQQYQRQFRRRQEAWEGERTPQVWGDEVEEEEGERNGDGDFPGHQQVSAHSRRRPRTVHLGSRVAAGGTVAAPGRAVQGGSWHVPSQAYPGSEC